MNANAIVGVDLDWRLLFVDDSDDETPAVIRALATEAAPDRGVVGGVADVPR